MISPQELDDPYLLDWLVDGDWLHELCESFYGLFGVSLRLLRKDGHVLAEAHRPQALCRYLQSSDAGRSACQATVASVLEAKPQTGLVAHPCFTGASYRIAPMLYQGLEVGRIVIGPYVSSEQETLPEALRLADPQLDAKRLAEEHAALPRLPAEAVDRLLQHLQTQLKFLLLAGHRAYLARSLQSESTQQRSREVRQLQARLMHAESRLADMERVQSSFLTTVSHELRTPLTSILGYSDMLLNGSAGELAAEPRDFVEIIRRQGDHLLALIHRLLDLARIDQGSVPLQREWVRPALIVEECVRVLSSKAREKNQEVEMLIDDPLPALHIDLLRLGTALGNLGDNALKFSPEGAKITFRAYLEEETRRWSNDPEPPLALVLQSPTRAWVVFAVSDTGPGIEAQERIHIFDPFYRIEGSTRGAGLGLAIAKRLIEAQGGSIQVDSVPGQGSTFLLRLPVPEAHDLPAEESLPR